MLGEFFVAVTFSAGFILILLLPGRSASCFATNAGLADVQFEEDIDIRAKARGERLRCGHTVKPSAAGLFGLAGFAPAKCSRIKLRRGTTVPTKSIPRRAIISWQ